MADISALAVKTSRYLLLYTRNILTNLYRRLLILAKQAGIFWQQRRLGRQYRRFGQEIYSKYTAGDVNPLLQEEVKDLLAAIQAQVDQIDRRRQGIQAIREQIKATSYRLEAEPAAPTEPGPETTPPPES
jgi:hypothetical protein